jgi:hypothetical protein
VREAIRRVVDLDCQTFSLNVDWTGHAEEERNTEDPGAGAAQKHEQRDWRSALRA